MFIKFIKKINLFFKILLSQNYYFETCKSQNDNKENLFLVSLSELVENKNFVEIGFHHLEYNTIGLFKKNFSGQLIDGGSKINVFIIKDWKYRLLNLTFLLIGIQLISYLLLVALLQMPNIAKHVNVKVPP